MVAQNTPLKLAFTFNSFYQFRKLSQRVSFCPRGKRWQGSESQNQPGFLHHLRAQLGSAPNVAPETSRRAKEAAEESSRFLEWLRENKVYLSDKSTWGKAPHPIAISNETYDDGEPSGRGLVAVRSITQGEPIFEIPEEIVITKESVLRELGGLPEDIDEYIAIAIFLIQEREKGDKSFWAPYLGILPREEELIPLFRWNEKDLKLLEGSPTLAANGSLKEKLRSEFATTEAQIFSRDRQTFPEHIYTFEKWEWAFAVLFSRAISLQKTPMLALVPYADLINHNPFCSAFIEMEKRTFSNKRYVTLFVDRAYSKMGQIYATYGPKSNGELLLLYGFVVDRNPYDSVEISVSLNEDDPLFERKKKYREVSGVGPVAKFPLYADRYPKELIEYLRFCVATDEEFDSDFGEYISEKNESQVASAIIDCCKSALAAYPQSLEDDKALMSDRSLYKALGLKARCAIRQRSGEKKILLRTIANIEREIEEPQFLFSAVS